MLKLRLATLALAIVCMPGFALAAAAELAPGEARKAEKARSKPLQRCDQLSDKAELDCLQKARERILEARRKREASDKDAPRAPASSAAKAPAGNGAGAKAGEKK